MRLTSGELKRIAEAVDEEVKELPSLAGEIDFEIRAGRHEITLEFRHPGEMVTRYIERSP